MKRVLVKAFFAKNFGDDLFLYILFKRYSNIKWILDINDINYNNMFIHMSNVEIIKSKILKKLKYLYYKRYDAFLYIGGSIFMQINIWKQQYEERKKLFNIFINKPKFIIGANFGPFKEKEFLESYRELLKECTDVCFRDRYSFDLFKDLSNVRLAPDIVFQLKPKNLEKIKDSIGISLIEIEDRKELKQYKDQYIVKVKSIIEEGIKKGKTFTLFSFCEAQGDLKVINQIVNLLNDQYKFEIEVVNYTGNIDEFLIKFERMENIIGTRFHACILSQVFEQGLYPLIYSDKTYNVLQDIGLDKEYTYIDNIGDLDVNHVLKVIDNNKIRDKSIFREAEKQFDGLEKYINGESY